MFCVMCMLMFNVFDAVEMGLGKTIQTAAFLQVLSRNQVCDKMLVMSGDMLMACSLYVLVRSFSFSLSIFHWWLG